MPLKNARYRVKRQNGKKIRLAFRRGTNKVVEVAKLRKGKDAKILHRAKGAGK